MSDFEPTDHMMKLSGKDYLPVAARIVWLRRDYPQALIKTTLLDWDKEQEYAVFKAEVTLPDGGHAEATAIQSKKNFPLYLEKSETKAIGRALGFLGYGTMAAFEDEPDNPVIADAPVDRPSRPAPASTGTPAPAANGGTFVKYNDPGHTATYEPQKAVREELAARRAAAPTSPAITREADWTDVWLVARPMGIKDRAALDDWLGGEGAKGLQPWQILARLKEAAAPAAPPSH